MAPSDPKETKPANGRPSEKETPTKGNVDSVDIVDGQDVVSAVPPGPPGGDGKRKREESLGDPARPTTTDPVLLKHESRPVANQALGAHAEYVWDHTQLQWVLRPVKPRNVRRAARDSTKSPVAKRSKTTAASSQPVGSTSFSPLGPSAAQGSSAAASSRPPPTKAEHEAILRQRQLQQGGFQPAQVPRPQPSCPVQARFGVFIPRPTPGQQSLTQQIAAHQAQVSTAQLPVPQGEKTKQKQSQWGQPQLQLNPPLQAPSLPQRPFSTAPPSTVITAHRQDNGGSIPGPPPALTFALAQAAVPAQAATPTQAPRARSPTRRKAHSVPAIPAANIFDENHPVRNYVVFHQKQMIEKAEVGKKAEKVPSGTESRYANVRKEIRIAAFASPSEAREHAEDSMVKNDRRVKSEVRSKRWTPVENGPGEAITFRGETVYANGERHIFETREEWTLMSVLSEKLAIRRGNLSELEPPPILLDKKKVSVYRRRFDVYSVRVYPEPRDAKMVPFLAVKMSASGMPKVVGGSISGAIVDEGHRVIVVDDNDDEGDEGGGEVQGIQEVQGASEV